MGNCQAAAVVIQHSGDGKVEHLYWPATTAYVMRRNPGNFVALVVLHVSGAGGDGGPPRLRCWRRWWSSTSPVLEAMVVTPRPTSRDCRRRGKRKRQDQETEAPQGKDTLLLGQVNRLPPRLCLCGCYCYRPALVLLAPPRRESEASDCAVELLWLGRMLARGWSKGGGQLSGVRRSGWCPPSLPPCVGSVAKSVLAGVITVMFFSVATSLAPLFYIVRYRNSQLSWLTMLNTKRIMAHKLSKFLIRGLQNSGQLISGIQLAISEVNHGFCYRNTS